MRWAFVPITRNSSSAATALCPRLELRGDLRRLRLRLARRLCLRLERLRRGVLVVAHRVVGADQLVRVRRRRRVYDGDRPGEEDRRPDRAARGDPAGAVEALASFLGGGGRLGQEDALPVGAVGARGLNVRSLRDL